MSKSHVIALPSTCVLVYEIKVCVCVRVCAEQAAAGMSVQWDYVHTRGIAVYYFHEGLEQLEWECEACVLPC